MKKISTLFSAMLVTAACFAQFTKGNIVVVRVGDGTAALSNTGAPVYLDEFGAGGALVQSVQLPTTISGANKRLILSGTATSEGMINRTADGRYLTVTGYDRDLGGTGSLPGTNGVDVNRTVARIAFDESIDVTTAFSDYASAGTPRSVVSVDGNKLWMVGSNGGVRYATVGSTASSSVSTTSLNLRTVGIAGGQLYVSSGSGLTVRMATVGTGLPESTADLVSLPGFATSSGLDNQFFFADMNPNVPGLDVLYVADDSIGLAKYSLVNNAWVSNGAVGGNADDYRGLAGDRIASGGVILYATRKGGSGGTGGGELVAVQDESGYNAPITAPAIWLAAAAPNTSFRGVALAPTSTLR